MSSRIEVLQGRFVDPLNLRVEDIRIEDIAHSLAMQCRFSGYTSRHYSVAEHSVYVAQLVAARWDDQRIVIWGPMDEAIKSLAGDRKQILRQALLHDATEAYMTDVARPVKHSIPAYAEIEAGIWRVIAEKFNVPEELHPWIEEADYRLCGTEKLAFLSPLLPREGNEWFEYFKKYPPYPIAEDPVDRYPVSPNQARRRFLDYYDQVKA